jgi:hypothetical protein
MNLNPGCATRLTLEGMILRKILTLLLLVAASVVCLLPAWRPSAAAQSGSPAKEDAPAKVCEFSPPGASFSIPYVSQAPELNTDPESATWAHAASARFAKDCSQQIDYPKLTTEVRAFWTDSDLYLLFISPYTDLNLWLPADNSKDRLKLWDRDVVEFFLGDDFDDIGRYKEFEIAPTGDWVDLAIDYYKNSYNAKWNSGWERQGRIDEKKRVWYAAARVPLRSVSEKPVTAGTKWRVNLYRIDGLGVDPQRHFLCWQPTCVVNRDPNHVPEHFGTLVFTK